MAVKPLPEEEPFAQPSPYLPEGLLLASLQDRSSALLEDALAELVPRFRIANVVEAGISYRIAESKQRRAVGLPLSRVPATHALVLAAMSALGRQLPQNHGELAGAAERLNIICRRYGVGERLGFHRDSLGLFEEEVFGAVLSDSGPHGLVFRRRGASGEPEEFRLPEAPGLVFASGGCSRYAWSHGVPPRPEGCADRISITWRWLRPAASLWLICSGGVRQQWVRSFVADARGAQVPTSTLAAFLCRTSPWYVTKNDRMGPLLSAEAVAEALGIAAIEGSAPEQSARSGEQLEVALSLLRRWEQAAEHVADPSLQESAVARRGPKKSSTKGSCLEPSESQWELPDLFAQESQESQDSSHEGMPATSVQKNHFALLASDDESQDSSDEGIPAISVQKNRFASLASDDES